MLRNAAFLLMTEAIVRVASIALAIVIARTIGPVGYGQYTFALAFAASAATFADFGTGRLLTRTIGHDHNQAATSLGTIGSLRLTLSLMSYGCAILLAFQQPASDHILLLLFIASSTAATLAALCRAVFYGFERMDLDTATRFLERILATGGALALIMAGFGLTGLAIAFLIAAILDLATVSTLCFKYFARPSFTTLPAALLPTFRTALPLGIFGIILTISANTPLYILRAFSSTDSIGQFSAGMTPILALIPIPVTVASAALPTFARLLRTAPEYAQTAFALLWRLFAIVGFAAAPGAAIVAIPLIHLVYGNQFAQAGQVLQILSIGLLGIFPTQICVNFLVAMEKQHIIVWIDAISVVWQITIDLILVPQFSFIGAAIGMASSEILVTILFLWATTRYSTIPSLTSLAPAIPAALLMALVAAWVEYHTSWVIAILAGVLLYCSLLFLLRTVRLTELQQVNALLHHQP